MLIVEASPPILMFIDDPWHLMIKKGLGTMILRMVAFL